MVIRAVLISLSKAGWARRIVSQWGMAKRLAGRFVAGETAGEAVRAARELNAHGILVTLDPLGENTTNAAEAERATQAILQIIDEIEKAGVRSNVSIKLSQIGLILDQNLCVKNLRCILDRARERRNFVRIDMEDSSLTESTLNAYDQMRDLGYDNVGVVIQAYLYRSEADIQRILSINGRVRLCKGAYKEPAEVAFPAKRDVDANYDRLAQMLLDKAKALGHPGGQDGRFPPVPALATHDPVRIAHARAYAEKIGLSREAFEFQMLYGIRRDLQESLVKDGYAVRVYVPYGTHWYPYLMRRLAERPANLWFIVRNLLRE